MSILSSIPTQWYSYGALLLVAGNALIHILFSVAVFLDARRQDQYIPTGSIFVKPMIWSLATLIGGIFIAAIYWLMHHSTLRKV